MAKKIHNWFLSLEENDISPVAFCLSDVSNNDFDKIIIGFNNVDSLKEILNFKKINLNKMPNLDIKDLNLIDPRKWKLNEIKNGLDLYKYAKTLIPGGQHYFQKI